MLFSTILFYIFSLILISSALVVVSAKNTVHSVMFLILAFINAAALFVMIGAEFIAMLLIVVYVGAIAVLFLFVVMMLNIDSTHIKENINKYLPLGSIIGVMLLIEIMVIAKIASSSVGKLSVSFPILPDVHNTKAIGDILYTNFMLPFEIAGAVLFVAMVGAIILTIREETRFIRKQVIADQVYRKKSESIDLVTIESGKGIDI